MEDFDSRYKKLNEQQRKAVDTIQGPVMVVAGPGSGKTELLSMRVANILRQTDVLPSSILCLTFTDSAAKNMRKRLSTIIGDSSYDVAIHTFHSFGTEVIGTNPSYFYEGAIFKPADELTQIQIMEEIFAEMKPDDPLNKYHPTQGYTFMRDVRSKISDLKRGGLTPSEFKAIVDANWHYLEKANQVIKDFIANNTIRSKSQLETVGGLLAALQDIDDGQEIAGYSSIKEVIVGSLFEAFEEAKATGSTKPYTAWKKEFVRKDKNGDYTFKDYEYAKRHTALAEVYKKYQSLLHSQGFIDFDDMLLQVVEAFEANPELRFNFQERYQYVLVDEFQDTSGVQMRLLHQLLDAPVNEGRPNVMVVGDDDQAIYKFQGANLRNILDFHKSYRDPEIIVMTKNYRSTQDILDLVRKVIVKGEERLENTVDNISKELMAASEGTGSIVDKDFETELEELIWVSKKINDLVEGGSEAAEIAVIGRTHRQLEYLSKLMAHYGIAVDYERNRNVLEDDFVKQLITILKFLNTLSRTRMKAADEYMPEILAYDFWQIDKVDIWKISIAAFKSYKTWLEVMLEYPVKEVSDLAKFFIKLAGEKENLTAEHVLDILLGNQEVSDFKSPFKEFYFSKEKLENDRYEYLNLLKSLKVLVSAIREFRGSVALKLSELVEFVELLEKHKVGLNDTSTLTVQEDAVHLMTAHKAKGLEFESVFVLSCQDDIWGRNRNLSKLSLPVNLPLSADSDAEDDMLRLFYVALSRAKQNLYLTSYRYKVNGKQSLRLRFLDMLESESEDKKPPAQVVKKQEELMRIEGLESALEIDVFDRVEKLKVDEEKLLKDQLEDYKLSVTHLANFVDLQYGGPAVFLERNLLRFPQALSVSAAYGSAMHNAMDEFYKAYKSTGELPSLDQLCEFFKESLLRQRLLEKDFEDYLEKGKKQLSIYYNEHKDKFDANDLSEMNFASQGVLVGSAHITGKIDRMKVDKEAKEITVIDYKTGKPLKDWKGSYYEKGKTWKYRMQLVFYKLLVEGSREFKSRFEVNQGALEFLDAAEDDAVKVLSMQIQPQEVERLKSLIEVVYDKIMSLDFPDVSKYSADFDGTQEFIEDLLSG